VDRYDALVEALRAEIPGFRIVRKDRSPLHRAIHYGLVAITLGQMRRYLDSFQTTIGKTVYVTADWDDRPADDRYVTLRHEAVHLRQFRRFTLPVMAMLYVLLPLPMGLAYCRARFEQEAYAETIRAAAEVWGLDYARSEEHRKYVIDQFTGAAYGWMWPFRRSLDRWYDRILASLDEER
jgi:transposase InsO family protein